MNNVKILPCDIEDVGNFNNLLNGRVLSLLDAPRRNKVLDVFRHAKA